MLFIARFYDNPGIAERRTELLDQHFAWLDANKDRVLLAGSVRTDVGGDSLGGLWIIEAESKADVENVYKNDPFFANGLRSKVEVFHYVKANADRPVTL
jgi:uncharacterized protein YciI